MSEPAKKTDTETVLTTTKGIATGSSGSIAQTAPKRLSTDNTTDTQSPKISKLTEEQQVVQPPVIVAEKTPTLNEQMKILEEMQKKAREEQQVTLIAAVEDQPNFQQQLVEATQQQEVNTPQQPQPSITAQSATSTATVAAPHGVNPSMMSDLLHTAAAVAAAQQVAAATVQVLPGQPAGTIQLVSAENVSKTQEMMARGVVPQLVCQPKEEQEKYKNQTIFTYLVTSQGTLVAANSSDGNELITGGATPANNKKRGPQRKGKAKSNRKNASAAFNDQKGRCFGEKIPWIYHRLFLYMLYLNII